MVREAHPAELRQLRGKRTRLDKTINAERRRLEALLAAEQTWSFDEWQRLYLRHGVTRAVAGALIWTIDVEPLLPPNGSLVPAVVGDNYQVALGKLSNAGFSNINVANVTNPQVPNGTVVAQTPHAGQRVPASTQITLSVVKNAATPSPTPTTPSPTPSPTPSSTPSP